MPPAAQPSVFVSHGSPLTILIEDDYAAALRRFARECDRPRAVVVMSAHGITRDGMVSVTAGAHPAQIYDFGGFPPELYRFRYPCPGAPDVAAEVASRLSSIGLGAALDPEGGLDHGVWVPLGLMFPAADVPVVQVSMPFPSDPRRILEMGNALAPLRDRGVLLVGSGGAVHNLRLLDWHGRATEPSAWATEFTAWLQGKVNAMAVADLLRFETDAPHARVAHPTTEHFQPIFFTMGAARDGERPRTIIDEFQYETLSMYSFALG